jgi:hypothetical protein
LLNKLQRLKSLSVLGFRNYQKCAAITPFLWIYEFCNAQSQVLFSPAAPPTSSRQLRFVVPQIILTRGGLCKTQCMFHRIAVVSPAAAAAAAVAVAATAATTVETATVTAVVVTTTVATSSAAAATTVIVTTAAATA